MNGIPQIDSGTLARAREGDMQAHAKLYEVFAPAVYTLARRILASDALAEDALQETFLEVIGKVHGYRGDGGFYFWIKRIAANKCLTHLRSPWVRRRVDTNGEEVSSLHGRSEARGHDRPDAPDTHFGLERALDHLSDTARAVLWLHDVEGYTHGEIGRMMGRTTSFSKSQLARAHERLRILMEPSARSAVLKRGEEEPSVVESGVVEPCTSQLKTC